MKPIPRRAHHSFRFLFCLQDYCWQCAPSRDCAQLTQTYLVQRTPVIHLPTLLHLLLPPHFLLLHILLLLIHLSVLLLFLLPISHPYPLTNTVSRFSYLHATILYGKFSFPFYMCMECTDTDALTKTAAIVFTVS